MAHKQNTYLKGHKPPEDITKWTEQLKHFRFLLSDFTFFFPHSNLVWCWCCAINLIHKGLNIEQLLNFSLLHNDHVIWLHNVHRMKSENISCSRNSLLESHVLQVDGEPKCSLGWAHHSGSETYRLSFLPEERWLISPPAMKFSTQHCRELTAVVKHWWFHRKTLHSLLMRCKHLHTGSTPVLSRISSPGSLSDMHCSGQITE